MAKKQWTDEERKAFGEKMKAARQNKNPETKKTPESVDLPKVPQEDTVDHIAPEQNYDELKRQLAETQETMALLKAAFLGGNKTDQNVSVGKSGSLVGEVTKYLLDPANYPDPTVRLRKEPRLQPLAFDYNYELEYQVSTSAYETKTGVNMIEPKFLVTLNRIVVNDQGEQTNKRYVARKLIFHEDPQAALVIARDNNIDVDKTDETAFLNEMRYLRVRDWLFDIFWPKPATSQQGITEEVIGGQLVQVFYKSGEESGDIDFGKLGDSKLRV